LNYRQRANFDSAELAVVLSHYDLGVIESVTELPRGSRRSPKVGIVCQRGKFLLKQRALTRVRLDRVELSHRIQKFLREQGFPLPQLVATRAAGQLFLIHADHLYELFEFVPGHGFSRTAAEARDAGAMLARFHQILSSLTSESLARLPTGDYHDAPGVRVGLCRIEATLSSHDSFSGDEAELAGLIQFLLAAYDHAAEMVNRAGFAQWPQRLVHSDWHAGNLLFRDHKVLAVLDYDALRLSRVITDVANGALHFSIIAGEDPTTWPDHLDEALFAAFLNDFEKIMPLTGDERRSIVPLMAEALIAECVPPITETGSVGRWSGFRVLQMVRRKLSWLAANGHALVAGSGG